MLVSMDGISRVVRIEDQDHYDRISGDLLRTYLIKVHNGDPYGIGILKEGVTISHEVEHQQSTPSAEVEVPDNVDYLNIPAFLRRQTS